MKAIKILSLALFISLSLSAKVLIFTYSYNRPDFIEIQHKTFQKFLLDAYEFIVFNDAIDENVRIAIENMCNTYAIPCIRIPQEIHDSNYSPSARNCDVVKYSLEKMGFHHNDILVLIDSDMFLIKEFSIRNYLAGFELAGVEQIKSHINYLWIGIVFLNMATMPNKTTINFDCGQIENINTDSGGHTYNYLKNNPWARVRYFNTIYYAKDFYCDSCKINNEPLCIHTIPQMQALGFSLPLIKLCQQNCNSIMEIFLDSTFLHYRAGSNWMGESNEYHQNKTKLLNTFINELIEKK
jgi:hypothetical protein